MIEDFYKRLKSVLNENQILIEEPLARHTTFQIGGPAQFMVIPKTIAQIEAIVKICKEEGMPFYVLGNGSNLLVSDKGYRGTIIKLGQTFSNIRMEELKPEHPFCLNDNIEKRYLIQAEAGVLLSKLANHIGESGLTGFEFAAGIPGTLGGAVTMNAGAYGGEMKESIFSATILDTEGYIQTLSKDELNLGYRKSIIQENNYIVLEASFLFEKGNIEDIMNKIKDFNGRRREKQPLEYPSAGSTFKRPEGYYAGKLIMDSGLRGYKIGNAQISEKHCGFVINTGNATAQEVRTLISNVIQIVYDKFGVKLEPEVKLLGEL